MKRIRIGTVTVEIDKEHVVSTLADGARVEAEPHDTADYAATAEQQGYGGDVAGLNRDHELAHHVLANALGLAESPVMRAVANGTWQHDPDGLLRMEEDAVMVVQRWAKALGIDMIALGYAVRSNG